MEHMSNGHTKKLSMDPAEKLRAEQQIQRTCRDQWRAVVRIVLVPFILVWTIAFLLVHHYFPDELAAWNPFRLKPHHHHPHLFDGNNPLANNQGLELVPWEGPLSLDLKTSNIYLNVGEGSNADLRSHLLIRTGYVLETQLFIKAMVSPAPRGDGHKPSSSVLRLTVPDNHHGIQFWMDESQPHASARLDLQLVVPTHFKGTVDVAGSWLYIETRGLESAQLARLALKTRRGDIRLQGTVHAEEVLAETVESGSVRCDLLASAERGQDFNATIKTGSGNIVMTAETNRVVEDEDLSPGFWLQMFSRSGAIDFAVLDHHAQQAGGDGGEVRKDKEKKMVPAPLMIRAESEAGYTIGRIEVGDKQAVTLLASSVSKEAVVQVSDNYSGKVAVGSPLHADIVAVKDSKSVIQYTSFSTDDKRCLKYIAGATHPEMVGDKLTVLSLASEAIVQFF
ncbi:hypothetical protein BGZ93_010103 [Podila epicladia]|nr:hypothetical protein BGZ92_006688 [Podila epicladia]KAG0098848.1 hypothetical protein BGZ93_010103 [Podila epicladia]